MIDRIEQASLELRIVKEEDICFASLVQDSATPVLESLEIGMGVL